MAMPVNPTIKTTLTATTPNWKAPDKLNFLRLMIFPFTLTGDPKKQDSSTICPHGFGKRTGSLHFGPLIAAKRFKTGG